MGKTAAYISGGQRKQQVYYKRHYISEVIILNIFKTQLMHCTLKYTLKNTITPLKTLECLCLLCYPTCFGQYP